MKAWGYLEIVYLHGITYLEIVNQGQNYTNIMKEATIVNIDEV